MNEDSARERMVSEQLESREVRDRRVLDAMRRVPRHLFVPEPLRDRAYEDRPQPIGVEQTISQPLMVGMMTELLSLWGDETVLEVGTGSGYQTAILAELSGFVVSIERHAPLANRARGLLEHLGYRNVDIHLGDGTLGYPPRAPYDRILVTAGSPEIPRPLIKQLALNGRMVIPVGRSEMQTLKIIHKDAEGKVTADDYGECLFVPLIGSHGWPDAPERESA
jgi:protein-L-isoaspartate(D-aspartate) O-methyltransferase